MMHGQKNIKLYICLYIDRVIPPAVLFLLHGVCQLDRAKKYRIFRPITRALSIQKRSEIVKN
jgi:hypothetical protein